MEVLINKTGNKTIVESARDHLWGTGVPLSDPDCLNTTKWTTQGILGELLEEIRDNYRKTNVGMILDQHAVPSIHCVSQTSEPLACNHTTANTHNIPVLQSHETAMVNTGEPSTSIDLDPAPADPKLKPTTFRET